MMVIMIIIIIKFPSKAENKINRFSLKVHRFKWWASKMMKEQRIFVVCLDIFEIRKEILKYLNIKKQQQQQQMNNNFND